MRILGRILLIGIVLLLSTGMVGGASAYLGSALEFPESGFAINGEYEAYYNSLPDPLLTLGLPISAEIITNETSGESIQYFSRAQLNKVLDHGQFKIERVPLGSLIYQPGTPEDVPSTAPCRVFSNGRRVCYAFQQFYESNNGEENFGLPISELENETGRLVQYFEYARFEWRPEIISDSHVVLSDIGKIHMDIMGIEPNITSLNIPSHSLTPTPYVGPLNVLVFTKVPVAAPGGKLTIFVVVQNTGLQGVANANITASLIYPDGSEEKLSPAFTDEDGILKTTLDILPNLPAEQIVQIRVNASSNGNTGSGQGWFRIRP